MQFVVAQNPTYCQENLYYQSCNSQNPYAGVGINLSPVLVSEPGSVGDFCTTDRVPKKFHLSPPLPSFPPMSVTGLGLLSSGVVRNGAGLSWNQDLDSRQARATHEHTSLLLQVQK